MSIFRPRSLQLFLALRLGLLFVLATALAFGAILYQTYRTGRSLADQNLLERAQALVRSVKTDAHGQIVVSLPDKLAAAYGKSDQMSVYAVRADGGALLAASGPDVRTLVAHRSTADEEPRFFHLDSFGPASREYDGLDVRLDSSAGPLSVTVAEAGDSDAFLHAVLREFISDIAWIIPVFVVATLGVGILAIRQGLRPLRQASAVAATIGPGEMTARMSEDDAPTEIRPLIAAMNRAIDRLERGFALQREFTANAAHELRTPLTIITGALDAFNGSEDANRLRQDVARMNRLVDQLLRVARLDGLELDVSSDVDLSELARQATEHLAPIAIRQDRTLAFVGGEQPAVIKGNRHAIEDALRNLIENAISHAPRDSEVEIVVSERGDVSVSDRGPGVRPEDRERIFDRFWRAKGSEGTGAGLGLSIVQQIMKAHGGEVDVTQRTGGGASFSLRFARQQIRPNDSPGTHEHRA